MKFDIPKVSVTGSVGKTTTKDMVACVLSKGFKTLKSEGNHNNEIGLPLTIFGLDSSYGAAITEMGMNHPGEISRLSMCAVPTVCMITNIGVSHIENLGSQENILKAKLEMLDGALPDAPMILNKDDKLLAACELHGRRAVYYSTKKKDCDVFASGVTAENGGISFVITIRARSIPQGSMSSASIMYATLLQRSVQAFAWVWSLRSVPLRSQTTSPRA